MLVDCCFGGGVFPACTLSFRQSKYRMVQRRNDRRCARIGTDRQGSSASKTAPRIPSTAGNLTSDIVTTHAAMGWSSDAAGVGQKEALREQRSFAFCAVFFFCRSCVFANSYLENHQPPEARTTTDILRLYQYFLVVFSDLAYGGDKVV